MEEAIRNFAKQFEYEPVIENEDKFLEMLFQIISHTAELQSNIRKWSTLQDQNEVSFPNKLQEIWDREEKNMPNEGGQLWFAPVVNFPDRWIDAHGNEVLLTDKLQEIYNDLESKQNSLYKELGLSNG